MDQHNEIDMEDSDYVHFFNNLDKFDYRPESDHDEEEEEEDEDEDEEELDKDPEYNFFFENLKQDENGESYSVAVPISSDISIVLRYEEKEEESFENVDKRRNFTVKKKPRDVPVQQRKRGDDEILIDVPEFLGGFPGKGRAGTPKTVKKPLEIRDEGSKKILRDVPGQERNSGDNENKRKEGAQVDPVSCKSSRESSKMMDCVVKDESSNQFPVSLDKSGTYSEPSFENGHMSTGPHPKNNGSCSDVEVFTLDNMPLHEGDYTPFVPSKCYQPLPGEEFGDGIKSYNQSRFREKLMDLLKIPYEGRELNKLWLDVTRRKPVEGAKELRGRTKSYSTKTTGRSYLDWYKDLRMKIDEFKRDEHKVLCLLRGFFFWLKNTAHEDAFKPWLDSLYLKALTDHRL